VNCWSSLTTSDWIMIVALTVIQVSTIDQCFSRT